jgi:hypothetical protein
MTGAVDKREDVTELVERHLRGRGLIAGPVGWAWLGAAEAGRDGAGGAAVPLGVPGLHLGLGSELMAFGRSTRAQARRLTDLLAAGDGDGLFFASRPGLEAAAEAGRDPVLYYAYRDVLPPRDLATGERLAAGDPGAERARGAGYLFADLVVYQPGLLPGGELFRSTGHWNQPEQLEIFQTLTGTVVMLVAGRRPDGAPYLYEQVCGPGEVMAVPLGAWHVSYVLDGPAAVFNVAAHLGPGGAAEPPRQAGARQEPGKYERARAVPVTLVRAGTGYRRAGPPGGWPAQAEPPDTTWARPFVDGAGSLADLHLHGSAATLAALASAAGAVSDDRFTARE